MHVPRSFIARWSAALVAVAALVPGSVPAQGTAARSGSAASAVRAAKGPTVEGITAYTLPNGLRFLIFPDATKPTATVNITYLVGSRFEGYGETGMAHLFEHMLFKGSTKHTNIPQELTEHGARPNGSTWFDRTNYYETFPATDENLAWALDLEADRMVNSFLRKEDLESEMTVVRNELEAGENSPFAVLMDRVMSTAYLWHGYGRSTIGARSDLESVPIERLHAWYHKYYQPDQALLVVAGKIDEKKAVALVEQKFGAIPAPDRTGPNKVYPTYTREPPQDGERSVTLRRVGDLQVVMAGYHIPAGAHPDFPAVAVLAQVLSDPASGRLFKNLVETKLAARVGASRYQLAEPSMLVAYAQVRNEDPVEPARDALLKTLDEVVSDPPSTEEVDRARTALLKQVELNLNNPEFIALDLSEWAAMGDWRLLFINRDRLRKVTPADVKRVAAAYLKRSNLTLGTFVPTAHPDRAVIAEPPPLAPLVANYKGDTTRVAGEVFDASPANIEARATRLSLPNGMKVVLLPKRNRGAAVTLSLTARFGSEQTLSGRAIDGDLAGDMLMRGTEQHNRQQLRDELDRLHARGGVSGSISSVSARMETTRDNLDGVIRLVGEILRHPAFDSTEFEQVRQDRLASLENGKSEPTTIATQEFARRMSPHPKDHPNYVPTYDEQKAALTSATVEGARKFYHDFYGPGAGEVVVVGDFDPDRVTAVLEETLGDWKSPTKFARIPSQVADIEPVDLSFETPDKANAFFEAGFSFPLDDQDPDYPALLMANYMLGGGFLNSRLATRIRQKDGLSYSVGSIFSASAQDENATFITYAIYNPQNVARLEAAFREEMDRAIQGGFTAQELAAAREGFLQSRKLNRAQDGYLVGVLGNEAYLGRTMAFEQKLEDAIAHLTVDRVNAALQKHFDTSKLIIVKAGDFANNKPKT